MPFTVEHSGVTRLLKITKKAGEGIRNMRGVNLKAVIVVEQWVKRNIDAQGRLHEDAKFHWPPLSERRRRELEKKGRGSSPAMLNDTSTLRSRWQRRATNQKGELKAGVEYSEDHERGKGGTPQRKIFPTPSQGEKILHPLYQKYFRGLLK